jgi:hypothetical protein
MSATSQFYLTRAAECARDAEKATLENVRERCRRAEAAWLTMADRIARGEAMRDRLAAEKAAQSDTLAHAALSQH